MQISSSDLQKLVDNAIINEADIMAALDMLKRQKHLELHPYSIWQGENQFFYTKLLDISTGKKKLIKKKSRKALEDAIVQHYEAIENRPTIAQVFERWTDEKLQYSEITKGSYDRYHTDYCRFFKGKPFESMLVTDVQEEDIEAFIKTTIAECNLSRKAYAGLRIIISGIFKYAKKKKLTEISISSFFGDLQLPARSFERKVKDKDSECFTEEETRRIMAYCLDNPNIWNLGVALACLSGLRVGELSTLKFSDIGNHCIHVQRTEVKYKDENGKWTVDVGDYPKTEAGDRYVVIPEQGVQIIAQIHNLNKNSEFVFVGRGGQRVRGNTFNKRLSMICDELGIKHRSFHKIRKTYATTLIDSSVKVPEALIMEQLGHKDISTTKRFYYRNRTSPDASFKLINQAVNF